MIVKLIKFLALAYIVAFCQSILANLTSIGNISPNYGTVIILVIVLRKDFQTAFSAAIITGIVIDALNPDLLGLGTVVRFGIAVAVYELKNKLDIDRIAVRLYLVFGCELAFQLIYQPLANRFDFQVLKFLYLQISAPTIVYTTVIGVVVLLLADLEMKLQVRKRTNGSTSV